MQWHKARSFDYRFLQVGRDYKVAVICAITRTICIWQESWMSNHPTSQDRDNRFLFDRVPDIQRVCSRWISWCNSVCLSHQKTLLLRCRRKRSLALPLPWLYHQESRQWLMRYFRTHSLVLANLRELHWIQIPPLQLLTSPNCSDMKMSLERTCKP